ncbi:MAG TPA: inositol monophosphatase family protein [Candidatus Omnitrophota bacterium]|nr:inositol monophosphatase family protein [Candidatus Omnitrophota bacterium]
MTNRKVKQTLEKALVEAGSLLKRASKRPLKIEYKGPVSIVTQVDKKAERLIIDIIRKQFPNHSILAEESEPTGKSNCKWIIDPIDGTSNFAHGLPMACVSIAYEENGIVEVGGVWNPFHNEWFWAERGKGASLNGKKIRISKIKTLKDSMLVTGFPYDRRERARYYLNFMEAFMMKTQGIRRLGSAALDTCYVACGRFDGYWEFKLNAWDVAAAALIAEEAGAKLTDFSGKRMSIYGNQTLVTNGLIHNQMLRIIKKCL